MLGNQVAVLAGASHPNAGKLLVEYLLSKEGTDVYVAGDAVYSFRANYEPPAAVAPLLFDLNEVKLVGLDDRVDAQRAFKEMTSLWTPYFRSGGDTRSSPGPGLPSARPAARHA